MLLPEPHVLDTGGQTVQPALLDDVSLRGARGLMRELEAHVAY